MTTDLMIGIGAEYRGKPAFNKAESATQKLTKSVRNLALATGVAFSAKAVLNFARASVRASLEASAQQERLAKLLRVTNDASSEQIDILTQQANALEQIGVVSAGNITQIQSQLATFDLQILTISKLTPAILDYVTAEKGATASAAEFKSMTNGLAQALNGNFTSLTKTGFVLDDVTKKMISTGTETERAEAIVKVLNSTYKDFNKSLRDTPEGQFQILANSADKAREIIGTGLVDALKRAFGNGDIEKAADNIVIMAEAVASIISGFGTMVGWFGKLVSLTDKLTPGYQVEKARANKAANAPYDPRSGNLPDMSPAALELIKKRNQADRLYRRNVVKLNKEAVALEKKKTAELKKQEALKKAMKVLDTASNVFDIDLIQNTAALMGKISADEALRLRLQQAILLENEDAAASLAQQLLASQIAAMKLANQNPLEGWGKYFADALDGLKQLRDELAALGTPKVAVGSVAAPVIYPTAIANGSSLGTPFGQAGSFVDSMGTPFGQAGSYVDSIGTPFGQAGGNGTQTVKISIDPNAAAYGITAAVINNSANGNSNSYNPLKSFAGGA